MIKNITLEQILTLITFLISIISAVEYLCIRFKKNIKNIIKNELSELTIKIKDLEEQNKELELNTNKNFLVRFLSDIEQGNQIYKVEEERFYETYKRYHNLGGNSYIDHQVEKLKKEGKL